MALVAFVISSLCWQVAGQTMALGSIAQLTVRAALPLVFGALGGVLGERTGVINVAIEGQLLTGAFAGAFFGTVAASAWVGLVAAAAGGVFIGLSILWGWQIDRVAPDRFDLMGACVALIGVAVIMYWPRV